MWTAEWEKVVQWIVEQYNRSQDVYEVIALSIPTSSAAGQGTNNASQKVLLAIAGGHPPDCMAQWNSVLPAWAAQGLIRPLDEVGTPEEIERFREGAFPIALKIGGYQDRLYGVTTGINAFALYYNVRHLREAGLDPANLPDTMAELLEWRERLTRRDPDGNLTRLGLAPIPLFMAYPLFGDDLYDPALDRIDPRSEAVRKGIELAWENNHYYGFDAIIRFQAGLSISSSSGGATGWPFMSGQYSMAVEGQWRVEQLARYAPDLEYVTGPIPNPEPGQPPRGFASANFMIIPTGAACPEGAWDFIKFWSGLDDPQRAARLLVPGGWLPTMRATAAAPAYREFVATYPQFETFVSILHSDGLQPMPPVVNQVFLSTVLGRVSERIARGSLNPNEAMDYFAAEWAEEESRRERLHP
jgi:multiple sugar transport system substrate-binding protein